ncbi:hypothetical protein [Streptomyces sp. 35G-GA-8]|uniref:hypothetical protein n=1 Tax=Streptomyces sp. 35G-GA-8 TaxID=2939434 RepID=UPI0035B323C4
MAVEEVESGVGIAGGDVVGGAGEAAAEPRLAETAVAVETMAAKRYAVHPDYRVNVRSGPGTSYRLVKVLPYGASVPINCQKPGEWVSGPYGTTNLWDNIANGQFVSDAYVYTGSNGYVAERCA